MSRVRVHLRYPSPHGTPDDEAWLTEVAARWDGVLDDSVMESAPQQRFATFETVPAAQAFAAELTSSGRWAATVHRGRAGS